MESPGKILAGISSLNLKGKIVKKQPYGSGLGGSCNVYTAWSKKHHKKVVIKQILPDSKNDKALAKKLASEIRVWANLQHEFVLPLLGFVVGGSVIPALISEWMERGTLHYVMTTFPRGGIETITMLRRIASGLTYLHSKDVIHGNLKTRNILISRRGEPLIADFGLALALSESQDISEEKPTSVKGSVRWMAKELLSSSEGEAPARPNKMTDVWSFGMIIYELLSWKEPYKGRGNDDVVRWIIENGELPEKPDPDDNCDPLAYDTIWKVAQSCWVESIFRPTAESLWDTFSLEVFFRKINARKEDSLRQRSDIILQLLRYASPYLDEDVFYKVYHFDPLEIEGHACHAQLRDDMLSFVCHPGDLIGPILSVEINYATESPTFPWPTGFKFAVNSGEVSNYCSSTHNFAVESAIDASSWVKTIESTLGTIVQYEKIASTTVDFRSAMDLQDDASYSRATFSSHKELESPEPDLVAEKIPGLSDEIKMLVGRLFSVA